MSTIKHSAFLGRRIGSNPSNGSLRSLIEVDALENAEILVDGNDRWTRTRFAEEVDRFAAGLANAGVRHGERVVLHLRSGVEIAIAYFACFRLGAIAAPLNLRFKKPEIEAMFRRLRPIIYIGHADLYQIVAPIDTRLLAADARYVIGEPVDNLARSWASLRRAPDGLAFRIPDPVVPAVLLSTSGTTGQPKLVAHSQETLFQVALRLTDLDLREGDKCSFFLPMVHASGLLFFLAALAAGACLIMSDASDPGGILDTIEEHRCTYLLAMPTPILRLMEHQRDRPRDTSSLRFCGTAGDVCLPGQQQIFPSLFGVPLRSFWASTEGAGSFVHCLQPGPVNRPHPDVEVKIMNRAGRSVRPGQPGEVLLRGRHIALGYWNGPDELVGFEDGWYRTGDIMQEDRDGNLWFVARAKDLIVCAGSNISPVEVEHVLASHPAVRDAGVVGIPDPVLGQRVIGFVQLANEDDTHRLNEIREFASVHLANYKVPDRLLQLSFIPRNTFGKIDRIRLSQLA